MTTPRLLSERYELGEVLGYGGMSEVHRGLDTRLGRDVAVKVLRADLARDPQFQMRFRREAQNAAALNHPAIVAVYDTGEVAGESGPLPYIVMEYVDGQTLREIVKTTGPMTQQRVIEVMADVCAALDFSHRHNIIHRDVKPANIMINRAGAVKVMDFGIARALGEGQNVTQTAAVIGTAQYLSPEQARGEAVDARSDVYAAGCVLFELLTGDPPFTGDTPVAVAYQHVREDPRRPSEVNPSVPAALDAVVLKALSKNPLNRYQSAAEMRSDLVRVRSGQSPMAPLVMSEDERTAMLAAGPSTGPTRRLNGGGRHTMPPAAPIDYDDYYDDAPRRSTARTVGIVVAVLVALGLVGFVAYQIFSPPPPTPQVAVPNVVGQSQQDARNQILAARLSVSSVVEVPSQASQIDQVLSTDPPVGTEVAERSSVTLQIGRGPDTVSVPALTGKTVEEATALLKDRGLEMGTQTTRETNDPNQVGKIISSTPGPGEDARGRSQVAVVVGAEQTTVQVPDVSGRDPDDAEQQLTQAGFRVGQHQEVDGGGDEGSVAGTNPPAGSRVARGSQINLLISRGNEIQVPNVVGESASDAVDALRRAGFRSIDQETVDVNSQDQDGVIVQQSIRAGSTAEPDDSITISRGRFSPTGNGGVFGNN
ncbi:Stk1 family PASTA domain-containing Ser/Thr kinase [Pseudonocardia alaniniphila]|uniref:non-specific serine/threonine protein kinase n=1 Tax=Pseudonocardia alaniniphila TaxID=75291 RepID=A0ABS9TQF9_9PSEU|nr:Stk1 family PASTA domain-containing Ser/Thr kinase [Pseudonocardia alaniniphila]MCH6170777.1 Stk1 family PASTA domain-containing Ser/Thr kinase [Pseudonocardia alaniniphila]